MINRELLNTLQDRLFKQKAIIITGPRQAGKTTLIKLLMNQLNYSHIWFNGDEPNIPGLFQDITSFELKNLIGKNKILVIDEAQRIPKIGLTLKLIIDTFPEIQVVATGSSAFNLLDEINEPLTGRKFEYQLYPFSFNELSKESGIIEEKRLLKQRLVFGSYPDVINNPADAIEILNWLSDSYLYKDLFRIESIKKPELLVKLLQSLSYQVISEVSYNELAQTLSSDPKTVEKYIGLLEKTFVVFRLPALSRNLRNEIKKSRKVYFFDNGIRNAIINNFNPINARQDIGALWENYLISERIKLSAYQRIHSNRFFWRTKQQQEIDYIEERAGKMWAYEFKYSTTKTAMLSKSFKNAYPQHNFQVINPKNYPVFLRTE
ncbi:MAG: ATP-binding protein [Draconibacterium sp.]|nr:ATP-binding protein [Draconibacterium sp.]